MNKILVNLRNDTKFQNALVLKIYIKIFMADIRCGKMY